MVPEAKTAVVPEAKTIVVPEAKTATALREIRHRRGARAGNRLRAAEAALGLCRVDNPVKTAFTPPLR